MKEFISQKIAYLLPKRVVYFALIRAWSKASTNKYSSEIISNILMEEVIKRWEEEVEEKHVTFSNQKAKALSVEQLIEAVESLEKNTLDKSLIVSQISHNCEKEKFLTKLDILDGSAVGGPIKIDFFGMPVYKRPYVPKDEVWFINQYGRVIKKFSI